MINSKTSKKGHIKTKISGTIPSILYEYLKISQTIYEAINETSPELSLRFINYIKNNLEEEIMVDTETFEKKSTLRDLSIIALLNNENNKSQ